jgi:predicted DsbA family dithiol-disulfide isomerase
MGPIMRIDVWSDVVCPWCYLGEHRLRRALAVVGHDGFEVHMRAFQLDPRAPRTAEDLRAVLERKYGPGAYDAMTSRLTALGADEGLEYRFDRVQRVNTFDAHRVLAWAATVGPEEQGRLAHALFRAYFTDGVNLADHEVLTGVVDATGLDTESVVAVLAGAGFTDEVIADRAAAVELGITGVPAFVLNGEWMIPGAQDVDTFVRVLERARERLSSEGSSQRASRPGSSSTVTGPENR